MQNLQSLRKSIKTHTYTAVCEVITLVRMAEDYYKCKEGTGKEGEIPGVLFIFDSRYGTSVAGWGPIFDNYCSTKQLGSYTGCNVRPCHPDDDDYAKSRLRIIPFDYAFSFITKDITKHMLYP